jgi:hypothetical protein
MEGHGRMTENEESPNIIGGPLDGGYREPPEDGVAGVFMRSKSAWHRYQWDLHRRVWVFAGSQENQLK